MQRFKSICQVGVFETPLERLKNWGTDLQCGAFSNQTKETILSGSTILLCQSLGLCLMLHSAVHWPDMAGATLWPMAVTHAIFLRNHVPNLVSGLCLSDVFSKSRWEKRKYHDLHVWGMPSVSFGESNR